jgi:hypothetical protein
VSARPDEQAVYARWLDAGARIGLAALVAAFALYVLGVLDSHVPREQLPSLWVLSLEEFRARTGTPAGWGWLALLHKGDYLSLAAVALLALATLVCYGRLVVFYFSRKEKLHGALALAQAVVLLAAASGFIGGGH